MRGSAIWLDVIPSMRGYGAELAREGARAGTRAGKSLGDALEKAAARASRDAGEALAANVEAAKGRVEEAAKAVVKARDAEADAAGKVAVAQAKLDELNQKGRKSAAQLAVATERLGSANRRLLAAQRDVTEAHEEDERAKAALASATADLDKETANSSRALVRLSRNVKRVDTKGIENGAKSMRRFSFAAYSAASATALLGGSVPIVAGMAAVLTQASGAALVMPGALALGGIALGAVALGVSGIADALKEWDDPEKFAEAIKNLSGEAQQLAITVRDLRPRLIGLRNDVQGALFAGAAQDVKALAGVYLPLLHTGLVGVAGEFASARREAVSFATEAGTVRDVGTMLNDTKTVTGNLAAAVRPLLEAFRDVGVVGSGVMVEVTAEVGSLAREFADFIAHARETGQLAEWMQTGFQVLRELAGVVGNVGSILYSVFRAANEQGGSLLDTLSTVTGSLAAMLSSEEGRETLAVFFRTLHDIVQNLQPGLRAVMGAIGDGIQVLGPSLPPVAQAFSDVAIAVAPLITDLAALAASILPPIARVLSDIAPVLAAFVAGFVAARIALAGYNAVVTGILVVRRIVDMFKAWAAAQWALNTAMAANPIGVIIALVVALAAGIAYLWTHNEGFRSAVITAWEWIKAAIVGAWEVYIKPAFLAIVAAVRAVGDAAVWLWREAIVPAAEAIGTAASWLWRNVLAPFFGFLDMAFRIAAAVIITLFVAPAVIAFNLLADAAMWLWEHGIKPSFDAVATAAQWLWSTVISPVVALHVAAFRMVAAAALWLYEHGIKPAFDAVAVAVGWVVDAVVWYFNLWITGVKLVWAAVQTALSAIGEFFTWLWETKLAPFFRWVGERLELLGLGFQILWRDYVQPAFSAIGDFLVSVWDNTIGRVFGWITSGVGQVGTAFDAAVGFVERVWGRLREVLAKPVNFLIQAVYNDGIRAVWNKVADTVGLSGLEELKPITFAGGGVIRGYAPGRDIVPALLSPGEAVLVPEAVRLLGARNILALNASVSGRRGNVVDGGYSGGGIVHRFAGGGVIGTIASWFGDLGQSVVDLFTDPTGFVRSRLGGGSRWIEQLIQLPAKLVGKIGNFLSDKVKSWFGGDAPSGGDQLAQWITAAMRITGVPGTWFGPLHTLIMRESGGNPKAINLWDINAQQGHPSQGLMQTIPSTFAAYRDPRLPNDITDPIANIVAGINYIRGRYGSIFSVQQAVGATPMGYDSGGYLPPGVTTVFNGTRRPEPVLSPSQWDALSRNGNDDDPVRIVGELHVADDGLSVFVDGRVDAANQQSGTAVLRRRR